MEFRSGNDRADTSVAWELRGRTGTPLLCRLRLVEDRWTLTLTMGDTQMHLETFTALADALGQVAFLRDDFTRSGWLEVFRADPPKA